MNSFEKKYGIKEDEKTKAFHKSRRMFCIYKGKLFFAEPNLTCSHAVWFEKEGWISKEEDQQMDKIVRGIINNEGDIYFYVGYDFQINTQTESIFFDYLDKIVEQLELKPTAKIFGGLAKQEGDSEFSPRKEYGQIKDYLEVL
jgi:hypothetical protein